MEEINLEGEIQRNLMNQSRDNKINSRLEEIDEQTFFVMVAFFAIIANYFKQVNLYNVFYRK